MSKMSDAANDNYCDAETDLTNGNLSPEAWFTLFLSIAASLAEISSRLKGVEDSIDMK